MKIAELPHNELERLAALERYGILDTPSDAVLDGIAQAAANLCETPVALISLIDSKRQWFKSCIGLTVQETPRDIAFCTHAILEPAELLEVEDATKDERFSDNPLVTGDPNIRFYAGKPLVTSDGYVLGTLCMIDYVPRQLSITQREGLSQFAQVVVNLLEERRVAKVATNHPEVEKRIKHSVLITDATQPGNPISYVSPSIVQLTGYSSAEMIGKNCRFLQGPDTNADSVTILRDAIAAGVPCTVVLLNYRKDGSTFWNELTVSPIKDGTGRIINFVGVQRDVTDKQATLDHSGKLADANAQVHLALSSRDRLAKIVEDSVNEIYVSNAETYQILDVNRAARENLGYTRAESQQIMPWDFVEGLTEQNLGELITPLLKGDLDAHVFETVHRRKDGSTYPVATHLQYMASQTPPVFVAIVQDITDRKQQAAAIELRENAIEALEVGVSITDATQEHYPLAYVNKALCKQTGYSAEELLNQNVKILQKHNRQQPGHLKIKQAQKNAEPVQVILESMRKDGSIYMDELSLSPVLNDSGELTHYIGITQDITERLEAEARYRQAQKIDAIGQLSGGIAHDFNNLLSVISGNLEFLSLEINEGAQRECLEEAEKAAQMGARLTRRLLTFAKQGTFEPEVLNINKLVDNVIELLSSTIGEAVSLSANLSDGLWNIHADPSEIENSVVNLVINARDALPKGGKIKVETANLIFKPNDIHNELKISPGEYVRLSVTDNGIGMSEELQARIFEPFFTTKDHAKGTGLGLSSIHGFVNQLGGFVRVFSEPGHGTTIVLYLPKHSEATAVAVPASQPTLSVSSAGARILVVEDNSMVRKMTVKRLRALGYITEEASSGKEALQSIEEDPSIDLVISDIVMAGGMSGFDVARWVKDKLPRCGILFASGYNDPALENIDEQTARHTVLHKPYSVAELQDAVNAALESTPV